MATHKIFTAFEAEDPNDCCARCGMIAIHRDADACISALRDFIARVADSPLAGKPSQRHHRGATPSGRRERVAPARTG